MRSKWNQNPEHRKILQRPGITRVSVRKPSVDNAPIPIPPQSALTCKMSWILTRAGLRTMNHFSSVGASQPVLSGKKPDKQRPDLRSLCHEEATGRGGEPSNPIATHFLLYFCCDPALHIPLWYIFLWSMLDSFSIVFALSLREKFANLLNWAFPDVGLVGSRKFCKTLPQTRTVGWEPTCPTSYVPTNQPPTINNRQSRSTITINGKIRSCKETINNQTDTSIALSFPPM